MKKIKKRKRWKKKRKWKKKEDGGQDKTLLNPIVI